MEGSLGVWNCDLDVWATADPSFFYHFLFRLKEMSQRNILSAILVIVCLVLLHTEVALADYVAAVAEHTVFMGSDTDTADFKLRKNLDLYVNMTMLAKTKNAQVLVFPEFGLTATDAKVRSDLYPFAEKIPEVSTSSYDVPCINPHYQDKVILSTMSCAAKTHQISILVNMIDWVDCDAKTDTSCPSDGHYQYNTDVVFNEHGEFVAKYHKSHEWTPFIGVYDQVPAPSQVIYKSSFGVDFGLFICFDIMFDNPAKELRKQGIEHFLYAVAQGKAGEDTIIKAWSKDNNAVMLSSNLGSGKNDCSGIINRGTVLDAKKYHLALSDFPEDNILVATVPV